MNKYIVLSVLLLFTLAARAQRQPQGNTQKTKVYLIQSKSSQGVNGNDIIKVYRGTFKQDYSLLTSDSAYFYAKRNAFDAFGHVVINQGDTLNIYADKLNYDGNTHTAILTDNVRLVDKDATLSTNYLTYNTATRIGTYTGGGKLVNKTNTLVSKNGYYFAFSRDAYFRYNVVLTTNDAVIKTDTLRYNSGSRIAYFLGPSHIYGNKNKDTLYSENGTYNTITEQAFFGRKNRYAQGTKTLKGDSLFYDRLKGYGRAIRHVTFNDREQKATLKGDLGTYYNADERMVMTRNAYIILETEQQDSTKTDSARQASASSKQAKISKADNKSKGSPPAVDQLAKDKNNIADTLKNKEAVLNPPAKTRTRIDSVYMAADSLTTQILTYKALKQRQENMRPGKLKDSLALLAKAQRVPQYLKSTAKYVYKPPAAGFINDNRILHPELFGKPKPVPIDTSRQKPVVTAGNKKPALTAKPKKVAAADSVYMNVGHKVNLSDTSRIRVLSAYHFAQLYKSDLQAKADSMFYSTSDSIIRCYIKPIIWTQGSQLSGDTVYLQMKNRKLNNMELFPNAFIVNIEDKDSTHFNQVAGKKMRGFFLNNKLSQMYVDGNAETIYFKRDSGVVTEMERSLTSRIKANFKNNEVTSVVWLVKPEQKYGPLSKFKDDERLLKGFIWQPKERPVSKEALIYAYSRRQSAARKAASASKTKVLPSGVGKAGTPTAAKMSNNSGRTTAPSLNTGKMLSTAVDSLRRVINQSSSKPSPNRDTTKRGDVRPSARDTSRANP